MASTKQYSAWRAIAAVSRLALIEDRPVTEAEINPLMVGADGVVAVDGLVILRGKT